MFIVDHEFWLKKLICWYSGLQKRSHSHHDATQKNMRVLKEALTPTPCVNTYLFRLPLPKGGRHQSHTHRQTDSTVSCHSTFTHFALIQSFASIHFGNYCATSNPSNWHFQSELEKCIALKHPQPSFWKQFENLKGFCRQFRSECGWQLLHESKSISWVLFIHLSDEITPVHGKFLTG